MPTPISIATVLEKNEIASATAILTLIKVEIWDEVTRTFPEIFYIVQNDENFSFNGQEYVAYPFEFEMSQSSGEEPSVSLTLKDVTGAIKQKMNQYAGAVQSLVTVMLVPANAIAGPPEISFTFRVLSSSVSDFDVSWELGNKNHLNTKFPRRIQMKDRCSWQYKSTDCGYVGGIATCDYSLQGANGCEVHANSANFGGFPGLNG